MPKKTSEIAALISALHEHINNIVDAARREGHAHALANVRAVVAGIETGNPLAPESSDIVVGNARRGPGRPKGSKNKVAAAPVAAKPKKKRRNPWAHMTEAEKKERVRKLLAGRGLKPKGE